MYYRMTNEVLDVTNGLKKFIFFIETDKNNGLCLQKGYTFHDKSSAESFSDVESLQSCKSQCTNETELCYFSFHEESKECLIDYDINKICYGHGWVISDKKSKDGCTNNNFKVSSFNW